MNGSSLVSLKVCRVPALLFLSPTAQLENINLSLNEALACEPMHDIANHISNIIEELPCNLTKEQTITFEEILDLTFGDKEVKRATYHKAALIIFAHQL
jgi:hypothetical protein